MNKKGGPLFGVGTVSVLTVLLVLCFAMFGVLSLSTARADLRLTEKTAQMTTAYYEAKSLGAELVAACLGLPPEEAVKTVGEGYAPTLIGEEIQITLPVTDTQVLCITFQTDGNMTNEQLLYTGNIATEDTYLPLWQAE